MQEAKGNCVKPSPISIATQDSEAVKIILLKSPRKTFLWSINLISYSSTSYCWGKWWSTDEKYMTSVHFPSSPIGLLVTDYILVLVYCLLPRISSSIVWHRWVSENWTRKLLLCSGNLHKLWYYLLFSA